MKNDVFNKAKELKAKYDELYWYRNKLYHTRGSSSLVKVTLDYRIGKFNSPGEIDFRNLDLMKEAIEKEIELVTIELDKLQEQFDNL